MLTTQFYFFIFNDVNCTCTRLNETSAPFDIFYDWTDTTICCRQQSVGVHVIFLEFGEMRSISTFHVVIFSLLFKCIIEREVLKWCEKPTSFNIFVKTVFKIWNLKILLCPMTKIGFTLSKVQSVLRKWYTA